MFAKQDGSRKEIDWLAKEENRCSKIVRTDVLSQVGLNLIT